MHKFTNVKDIGVSNKDGKSFLKKKRQKYLISIPTPLFKGIHLLTISNKH